MPNAGTMTFYRDLPSSTSIRLPSEDQQRTGHLQFLSVDRPAHRQWYWYNMNPETLCSAGQAWVDWVDPDNKPARATVEGAMADPKIKVEVRTMSQPFSRVNCVLNTFQPSRDPRVVLVGGAIPPAPVVPAG